MTLGNKLLGGVLVLALTVRKQVAREGAFLALALAVAVGVAGTLAVSHHAMAADLSSAADSGAFDVTDPNGDTIDASTSGGTVGLVTSNVAYKDDLALDVEALRLTITGAGTVNLGTLTVGGGGQPDDDGDTTDLIIGDGTANTVVIINGAVTGNNTGVSNNTADLDILIDAANAGAGTWRRAR